MGVVPTSILLDSKRCIAYLLFLVKPECISGFDMCPIAAYILTFYIPPFTVDNQGYWLPIGMHLKDVGSYYCFYVPVIVVYVHCFNVYNRPSTNVPMVVRWMLVYRKEELSGFYSGMSKWGRGLRLLQNGVVNKLESLEFKQKGGRSRMMMDHFFM